MDRDCVIRSMRESGATYEAISAVVGVTRQRVCAICKALGVVKPPKVLEPKPVVPKGRPGRKPREVQPMVGRKHPRSTYNKKFHAQKKNAISRGIAWELTFEQWLAWWGDDIDLRGTGHGNLQMQRIGDSGPYAIGNIKKGYPRDNTATWLRVRQNKVTAKRKAEHEEFLNSLMYQDSKPELDAETRSQVEQKTSGFRAGLMRVSKRGMQIVKDY